MSAPSLPVRLAFLVALCSLASAQQVIEEYDDPLTSYKPAVDTLVQGLRPTHAERGVHLDGSSRAGQTLGAVLAANPNRAVWGGTQQVGGVRLATGAWSPTEVDVALPTAGPRWIVARSFNARQHDGSGYVDSSGYQGINWQQLSQPEILLYEGTTDDKDLVYFFYGADRFTEFKRGSSSSDEFKGKNGAAGAFQYSEGSGSEPDTYTLTDQHGNQLVFFGFDSDADPAYGQLWKIVDPDGNVSYAGHETTASTAITDGFDASGRLSVAYDASDRRFTYTYTGAQLTEVVAEVYDDPDWDELAKVEYSYYVDADDYGEDNDLKLVKVTTPLTDSGVELVRKRYIRYWEGTFNASTNPGHKHAVKYVYDFEGVRNYDWTGDSTFDEDFLSASNSTLDPYASAYFEYDSAHRITKAWFNGQCGCSGAGDGTYEFEYETNGSYSDDAGYDTEWATRTIVKRPDGSYLTQYFDEVHQPLHQVVTDIDPDTTSPAPEVWASKVTRDSTGQVTEVSTPANVTGYTHSSASFTTSTSAGLVWEYDRVASGNMKGFLSKRKHKAGTSGTAYLDEKLTYTSESQTVGDVTVVRPLISARRVYPSETTNESASDSMEMTYAYAEYTSDPLSIETVTTTHPAVSTSKNGSGSTTETKVHYTERGLVDFEKSADGIITYREYTDGQLTKLIEDADTTKTGSGEDFENVSIPTGFSSSGSPLHRVTQYSYDAQGRSDEVTLPGGRITKTYYSKLADHRSVSLSYPKYVSTPVFHGPVDYTVSNQAGRTEVRATVALSGNTTTTALTGHIDETDSDPILAADLGTVASMTTLIYDEAGTLLEEERLYHDVPSSGAGTDGTNYDPTLYGYNDSGRRWRVKEPTGTIRRTVYDLHGRVTEQWIGKNDSTFDGGESSGTDTMVKTEALEYDSGNDAGNGLLTKRTLYVEDGTTDQRVTEFEYDLRGRRRLEKRPTAPHVFTDFDNLGRVTAVGQYSAHSSIDISTDTAATETTNRLALSKTEFDELGRAWKRTRHKIDDADGSDDDNVESLSWFDAEGRLIKTEGSSLAKTTYDRLGRVTHRFTLARDNDTGYSDADDVSGDIVMEEHQTSYEDDGTVLMRAVIQRDHDDWGASPTTGALDSNADSDSLKYTASNVAGRIQISAFWYDDTARLEDTVQYGTYGGSDFDRDGLSVPARSDTALRTTRVYYDAGRLKTVEDPRGKVVYYEYDDAGRKTKEVRNYDSSVNSGDPSGTDDNVTVKYAFTDGLMTSMTADLPSGSDDQVTTYTYGTTKGTSAGDSKIETGHLRQKVQYPDSSGGTDVVTFAYNAQGQVIYKKDQAGNVIETDFDDSGRQEHVRITTLDADFDGAVRRITTDYDDLGRRELVTQYDHATVGSGSVVDEVKFTYEDWGNVSKFEQDRNSAVGASGSVDDYEVSYTFAKNTTGRNTVRVNQITMPSGNVLTCKYRGDTDDRHDTFLSRLTSLDDGATVLAFYDYLGMGRVVGSDYYDVAVESRVHGSTSGSYPDLDRFNRITTNKWTRDLTTDKNFYEIDISYDRASNITLIEDNVHSGFDVDYTIDDVNRLTQAEEGTWSGSAITSKTREQQWTLDHVGNWDVGKLDLNGDGDFVDTDEYNDDRTHNKVNELTGRDTDDNGTDDFTLSYDEVGNLIDDGEDYEYEWDPFGRLRKVLDRDDDSLVAEYKYNGLNYRISVHADTDDDGDVDSNDKWYHSAYNPRWQELAVFREDDSDPKEEFVHHRAGLDGRGGSSYIDLVILRDKDADTAWTSASDGTLEERIYYCQNWRADVSALVKQDGSGVELQEWVKYSAYGVPFGLPGGDTDSDGDCDSTDVTQVQTWIDAPAYDVRGDIDLDGDVDAGDKSTIDTGFSGTTLGHAALSSTSIENRRGTGGYRISGVTELLHARRRTSLPGLGRWNSRDPLSFIDGPNVYSYVGARLPGALDPFGTSTQGGSGSASPGGQGQRNAGSPGQGQIMLPCPSWRLIFDPGAGECRSHRRRSAAAAWRECAGQINRRLLAQASKYRCRKECDDGTACRRVVVPRATWQGLRRRSVQTNPSCFEVSWGGGTRVYCFALGQSRPVHVKCLCPESREEHGPPHSHE